MANDSSELLDHHIRNVAKAMAAGGDLLPSHLDQFLRTGEEPWPEEHFSAYHLADGNADKTYRGAAKTALIALFERLVAALPERVRSVPPVRPGLIRMRIEPMVRGLVQADWQETALRELSARTFVLNVSGTKTAIEAELSTGWLGTAWQILWAFLEDHGLPPATPTPCGGLSGGVYAHIRLSAYRELSVSLLGPGAAVSFR